MQGVIYNRKIFRFDNLRLDKNAIFCYFNGIKKELQYFRRTKK